MNKITTLAWLLLALVILSPQDVQAQQVGDQSNHPQQHSSRASAGCAKASASIEFIICADATLAQWDARMGQAYKLRVARLGPDDNNRRELVEAQSQWMFQREMQCNQMQLAAVKSCIMDMIRARLRSTPKAGRCPTRGLFTARVSVSNTPITSASLGCVCWKRTCVELELQIGGCTTIIDSGQEMPANLAIAFGNRGNGYQAKRDFRNAVADYDRAHPTKPQRFNNV